MWVILGVVQVQGGPCGDVSPGEQDAVVQTNPAEQVKAQVAWFGAQIACLTVILVGLGAG